MTTDFAISEHDDGVVRVVIVDGELDIYTAPQLRTTLRGAVRDGRRALVLDLTDVRFVDSTALGVIISTMKALEPVGGRLVLVNTRASIAKTLTITGLDRLLEVHATRLEAVEHAGGGARRPSPN